MKARTRTALTTLALVTAAVGAVAYSYFGIEKKEEAEKIRKDSEEQVFHFEKGQVKSLAITAAGNLHMVVERSKPGGNQWQLVEPLRAEADKFTVEAAIDKLAQLKRRQEVTADVQSVRQQYGLDKPQLEADLTLDDGKVHILKVGVENPFDSSLYVQADNGPVLLVGSDLKYPLEKGPNDLREKQLLTFEDRDVKKLEVVSPTLAYGFERDGDKWKLTAPLVDTADDQTVNRILSSLHALRASAFTSPDPAHAKEKGLDKPQYLVQLTGLDGSLRTLAIGKTPAPKTGAATKVKSAPSPAATPVAWTAQRGEGINRDWATVTEATVKALDSDAWSLRDKTLISFDSNKVAGIKISRGDSNFEIKRALTPAERSTDAASWTIVAPKQAKAKGWKITGLLTALRNLRGASLTDESGKQAEQLGLGKPTLKVELADAGGSLLGIFETGLEKGERVYARSNQSPRLYEIDKSRLVAFPQSVDDLLEEPEKSAGQPDKTK